MRPLAVIPLLAVIACSVETQEPELPVSESSQEPEMLSEAPAKPALSEVETPPETDTLIREVYDSVYFDARIDDYAYLIEAYSDITRGEVIEVIDSISADSIHMRVLTLEEVMIDLQEVGSFLAGSGSEMSMNQIVRFGDLQTILSQEQQLALF